MPGVTNRIVNLTPCDLCRHRFQKPEKAYFWSRQSQELLGSVFQLCSRHLTRLKLAIANDVLLKTVAIHCPNLTDLEVQFAHDVTEEALFALAGKSVARRDQGVPR